MKEGCLLGHSDVGDNLILLTILLCSRQNPNVCDIFEMSVPDAHTKIGHNPHKGYVSFEDGEVFAELEVDIEPYILEKEMIHFK